MRQAETLEQLGRREAACAAYEQVLQHTCYRGVVYAGATAVAAFAPVAYPLWRVRAGTAGLR